MKEVDVRKVFDDYMYNKPSAEIARYRKIRKIRETAATISMLIGIAFLLMNILAVLTSTEAVVSIVIAMVNIGLMLTTTLLMDRYHPASALFLAVYVISNTMNFVIMFVSGIPLIYNIVVFSIILFTFVLIRKHKRI